VSTASTRLISECFVPSSWAISSTDALEAHVLHTVLWGARTWPSALTGLLGGLFVFVNLATQEGSAPDPFCCDVGDRVVGLGWLEVERAVRASSVVVPRVLDQDST
jgi:hypothetical protein